jgi:hypothetical protein
MMDDKKNEPDREMPALRAMLMGRLSEQSIDDLVKELWELDDNYIVDGVKWSDTRFEAVRYGEAEK